MGQRSVDGITGFYRPQKKHSPRCEFTPELHSCILKLSASPPPVDSPVGDHFITMVKETAAKKKFRNIEKMRNFFVFLIDLTVTKTLLTVRLLVTVSNVEMQW